MEIPPHPSWVCVITFSSSSANMAIAIAVVKEEEEGTPGGIAGTTMMTTDHTHHHPGDTAQDHQGTYICSEQCIVVTKQPANSDHF